jgi:hypothetical protein
MNQKANYKKYKRTKNGLLGIIYNRQQFNSKKRGQSKPNYTLVGFRVWALNIPEFHILFKQWEDSGYLTDLVPSFDRVNPSLSYTFDNLQVVTWKENNEKGKQEKRTVGKLGMKIICTEIQTGKETIYLSQREASRKTGVNVSSISQCLNGKQKKTRKYLWNYK